MDKLILKQDVIDKIKTDLDLAHGVCKAIGISFYTLPTFLRKNDPRLTQASVLKIIKEHLKIKRDSDLLIEQPKAATL